MVRISANFSGPRETFPRVSHSLPCRRPFVRSRNKVNTVYDLRGLEGSSLLKITGKEKFEWQSRKWFFSFCCCTSLSFLSLIFLSVPTCDTGLSVNTVGYD